jgi:hypothetical protein
MVLSDALRFFSCQGAEKTLHPLPSNLGHPRNQIPTLCGVGSAFHVADAAVPFATRELTSNGGTGGMKMEQATYETGPRMLPVLQYRGKRYFVDERLREFRNTENPHEAIGFAVIGRPKPAI